MKPWYVELFENYALRYDRETFAQGAAGECDFIERELNFDKSLKILDVGCGTGRHSIELAKRGYLPTGIDLSEAQLKRAREKASDAGVKIDFLRHDAGKLPFRACFDAAVMLCEGGFPLMETDEMNYGILKSVTGSLRSGAKFIFTTLNALFPLFHSLNSFYDAGKGGEGAAYRSEGFDVMTLRDRNVTAFTDDDGREHSVLSNERYYMPSEVSWLLRTLGFGEIGIFGAKLGAFSREDILTRDDFEMLVVAVKGADAR